MDKDIVLFDLDGTLIDPKEGITKSLKYALEHFGITVSDDRELYRFIGPSLKSGFMEFYDFDEGSADKAVAKYRERYAVSGIYENELYFGVEALLRKLKSAGKTLILATSKPAVYAEKILEYFRIDSYFSFVGGSELSGTRNEKNEVIRYILTENKYIKTDNAIMVGDRKHDIIGARLNGIESVGVLYGYGSYEELSALKPVFLAKDVEALKRILCGNDI